MLVRPRAGLVERGPLSVNSRQGTWRRRSLVRPPRSHPRRSHSAPPETRSGTGNSHRAVGRPARVPSDSRHSKASQLPALVELPNRTVDRGPRPFLRLRHHHAAASEDPRQRRGGWGGQPQLLQMPPDGDRPVVPGPHRPAPYGSAPRSPRPPPAPPADAAPGIGAAVGAASRSASPPPEPVSGPRRTRIGTPDQPGEPSHLAPPSILGPGHHQAARTSIGTTLSAMTAACDHGDLSVRTNPRQNSSRLNKGQHNNKTARGTVVGDQTAMTSGPTVRWGRGRRGQGVERLVGGQGRQVGRARAGVVGAVRTRRRAALLPGACSPGAIRRAVTRKAGVADHLVTGSDGQALDVPVADQGLPRGRLGEASVRPHRLHEARQAGWWWRRTRRGAAGRAAPPA